MMFFILETKGIFININWRREVMSRVGVRIQEARNKKGIALKQLAKKLGVSEGFLSDVENGRKILNEDYIKRVEKVLDIDLNEDIFAQVDEPVENLKEIEKQTGINKQWEDAFSHILKKVPVYDINFKEIYDYKYLPIIDRKVEGFNPDKVAYITIPDDSMRGFRIQKGDIVMAIQNPEIVNNSIAVVEIDGKRVLRQIKRLDSSKALLISHSTDLRTETKDVKSINVIARCVKVEIEL